MTIRKEDRYEFINDILSLWDKCNSTLTYWPEDLSEDFYDVMEKWEEREEENVTKD